MLKQVFCPRVMARLLACCFLLHGMQARADTESFTNLFHQGEQHEQKGESREALNCFLKAHQSSPTNTEALFRICRQYCDLMFSAKTPAEKKSLAESGLTYAQLALHIDPSNVVAHLTVAVCYGKLLPFSDNQTKVNYSRLIKSEAEKSIALDPKQDLSYFMLGCWNHEVADMGFFMRSMVRIAYGGLPKASDEAAIENFKKAIALAPNRILHHADLAKVYVATGQRKLALAELEKCRTLTPTDRDDVAAKAKAQALFDGLNGSKASH
jgi:tetratricopeptide (TPR) repeat protein